MFWHASVHPPICLSTGGGYPYPIMLCNISQNAMRQRGGTWTPPGGGYPDPPRGGTQVRYPGVPGHPGGYPGEVPPLGEGGTRTPRGGYPGQVPPRGVPRSGTPRGGTQVRYPQGGTQTPRGGTQVRYPPGGYPGQVPPRGYPGQVPPGGVPRPPWGGTQVRYPRGVPRSGTPPGGYPDPPGGYPGQVPPRGVPGPPQGGTRVGQQKEYSLHGGRYASCVHAGGLSSDILSWDVMRFCMINNKTPSNVDLFSLHDIHDTCAFHWHRHYKSCFGWSFFCWPCGLNITQIWWTLFKCVLCTWGQYPIMRKSSKVATGGYKNEPQSHWGKAKTVVQGEPLEFFSKLFTWIQVITWITHSEFGQIRTIQGPNSTILRTMQDQTQPF